MFDLTMLNTTNRYGAIAIFLHWLMALLIIGLLILGIVMVRLPISLEKLQFFGWHKEYGLLALALVFIRLIWRMGNRIPLLPLHVPSWQKLASTVVHYTFYVLMFAMPITGWLITSAAGLPVSFFGLFVLPDLIAPSDKLQSLFSVVHQWLGYGLIAIIFIHIGAAFLHHFIYKDDILKRILP